MSNYFVHTLLRARDWQYRPQFDFVCEWWSGGGQGVCALIGIGGAGKTAIADRFLQVLPGVLPDNPNVPKNDLLPTPNSTFVFSFYDAPNPEAFFAALGDWLTQSQSTTTVTVVSESGRVSYHQIVHWLQNAEPSLLILDGLERIQQDGTRGGIFGRIADGNLRDFLARLSQGYLPHLSALITSRFPLADLDEASPTYYQPINVEEIDVTTGIHLLQSRGVTGSDDQLAAIVDNCGRHALTVDMAGGLLVEFHRGDPTTNLSIGTAAEIEQAAAKEQDPRRRAVLKQELRFAKVASQYRAALQERDEAALALLERVCLFRLGVDAETLAAIFTGKDAQKVAGAALSKLSQQQLQEKLDLLVRMGLLEASKREGEAPAEPNAASYPSPAQQELRPPKTGIVYTIHPAVRDGFLSGLDSDTRQHGHEAAREGLTAALGDSPGENPSDSATLDLLEEIVHHTIQSGHVAEAYDIYRNRIGGYRNLGWRLGAYERGERICRAFAGGQLPEQATLSLGDQPPGVSPRFSAPPFTDLPQHLQAIFVNEWALYLSELGRLAAAARCYELQIEMRMRQEKWKNASIGNQNLCDVWLLSGRVGDGALPTAAEALRLAELADDTEKRFKSHAYRGQARALLGAVPAALPDFRAALDWQHKVESHAPDRPLYSIGGIWHTQLLVRLGRRAAATRLTEANQEILGDEFGTDHQDISKCQLVLSSLQVESCDVSSAAGLCTAARDWALTRDAKEVLCWSALVTAQIELAKSPREGEAPAEPHDRNDVNPKTARQEPRPPCETAIEEGLKIARDCGFGIFHIDLLLTRARLHLLCGEPVNALNDVRVALDEGRPASETTGDPELLAARDAACGYAWAVPEGLQLRGEALLLQAAQQIGSDSFVPAKVNDLPADVVALIDQAKQQLREALDLWQPLHDPEPEREDQNFELDSKPYNYRAAETDRILNELAGGVLTRYPLTPLATNDETPSSPPTSEHATMSFDVFLSHNSHDKPIVRELGEALKQQGLSVWLDEWELVPGRPWQEALEEIVKTAKAAAVLVGPDGMGPWQDREMRGCLSEFVDRGSPVIPVLLPGADQPELPIFLKQFTWVDLRGGWNDGGLERLLWGITGNKPASLASSGGTPPRPPVTHQSPSGPLATWQEKLEYLQEQEAIVSDAAQKFALKKQIEEAQEKIRELGG